ncbi:regulator of volume decrease after cellular swelling-domain-containing protein [Dendryphion nanum]|uniref:Regulator of volume decrease after cellular swelling-domain-containing protein n=1 Tax=Dendryphion nanum TaxID=256645 RepID=A0A9P9ECE7_9PLEO|nr:regulator of volume decrease after cellular swelling-domain-containing protein [Dendryphion nanum]
MALQHISTKPKTEDFTPLQEHQEQTPATFYGSKPVLYASYTGLTLVALSSDLQSNPSTAKFVTTPDEGTEDLLIKDVDIWVNSDNLILFQNNPTPTGVSIPFPSIGLHATMKWKSQIDALFMNVSLNDSETVNDDDDIEVLELTILPPNYSSSPETACIKEIFSAMNTCADLHPDPNGSDFEGEEDETAPGATGWITADNMDEYIDEDGNFIGQVYGDAETNEEPLGPGAGTVRTRDENEDGQSNGTNGTNVDGETKWQRTG